MSSLGEQPQSKSWIPQRLGVSIAVVLVAMVGAIVFWSVGWRLLFDDAFITYRYSRNLVEGLGFAWNRGGDPVAGSTSVLYTFLMLPAFVLHLAPYTYSVLSNIFLGFVGSYALTSWLHRRGWPLLDQFLASLCIFAAPWTVLNATNGMETFLILVLCLLAGISYAIYVESPSRKSALYLNLSMFGASLTRPEFVLVYVVLVMTALLFGGRNRRDMIHVSAIFVVLGIGYLVARWLIYGSIYFNSFYLKVTYTAGFFPGLSYVARWTTAVTLLYGVLILPVLVTSQKSAYRFYIGPGVAVAALLMMYLFVNPLMGGHFRFLWPLTPLVITTVLSVSKPEIRGLQLASFNVPKILLVRVVLIFVLAVSMVFYI